MLLDKRPATPELVAGLPGGVHDDAADASGPSRPASQRLDVVVLMVAVVAPSLFLPFTSAPFTDGKLVVVLAAAAMAVPSLRRCDRRLAWAAGSWVAAVAAATILGVHPLTSMLGREDQGSGLALVAACAVLLVAGTRVTGRLKARLAAWLMWTGVAASLVAAAARFSPALVRAVFGRPLGFEAAGLPPLGHPVYVGAFLGVSMAATAFVARTRPRLAAVAIIVLTSGISITGKRAPVAAGVAALIVAASAVHLPRRRIAALAAVSVVVAASWTGFDAIAKPSVPLSAARRLDELASGSALARPYVWMSSARAWSRRPVLGWGPGATGVANLSSATMREASVTGRVFTDAHNILVESAVTTGIAGAGALIGLLGFVLLRMRRAGPGWIAGAVVALGAHHLLQPVNVSLTPLLFLLLGVGVASAVPGTPGDRRRGLLSPVVLVAAVAMSGLAMTRLAASTMEANGRTYYSRTHDSLGAATRIEPWRMTALSALITQLALDARSRPDVAREVRLLTGRLLREHRWSLNARLIAADAEFLMRNIPAAAALLDQHLAIFPHDAMALAFRARIAEALGDSVGARRFREASLRLEPQGPAKNTGLPSSRAGRG